jgi:lysozyme
MKSLLILSTNELLKKGSQGAKVAQLQRILTDLKFNPGEIDGDFGNKTVAAVQQFQKQQGITADGIVGKQTQNALNKALENLTSTPNKTEEKAVVQKTNTDSGLPEKLPLAEFSLGNEILKKGSQGIKVEQLQRILTDLKFNPGEIDGDFGNKTVAAVQQFQQQQGITADGIVGKQTQNALNKALENPTSTPNKTEEKAGTQEDSLNTNPKGLYGGQSGKVPLPGVTLIKEFEGLFLKAYPDPLSGGKPITIGWGTTRKKDGSEWRLGETITKAQAEEILIFQLDNNYLPPLLKIPVWNELNVNQQGALLSFAYNLGANFYGGSNFRSMTRVLRDKKWNEIEETFLKYRNPGSSVEAGLKRRRQAEAKLFLTPVS